MGSGGQGVPTGFDRGVPARYLLPIEKGDEAVVEPELQGETFHLRVGDRKRDAEAGGGISAEHGGLEIDAKGVRVVGSLIITRSVLAFDPGGVVEVRLNLAGFGSTFETSARFSVAAEMSRSVVSFIATP